MEKFNISVDVSNSDNTCPYHFQLLLDDQLIAGIHQVVDQHTISKEVEIAYGDHELTFVVANKPDDFTKLDENGNIVKDALLTINNIKFDDIEIDSVVHQLAEYHYNNVIDKFYGPTGCNGQIKLKFTSPFYIWLLENM